MLRTSSGMRCTAGEVERSTSGVGGMRWAAAGLAALRDLWDDASSDKVWLSCHPWLLYFARAALLHTHAAALWAPAQYGIGLQTLANCPRRPRKITCCRSARSAAKLSPTALSRCSCCLEAACSCASVYSCCALGSPADLRAMWMAGRPG